MFGYPIPILTTVIGTPRTRPVRVKNARSEDNRKVEGAASNKVAIASARPGEPTVIYTIVN
jgi:hypothetical protein